MIKVEKSSAVQPSPDRNGSRHEMSGAVDSRKPKFNNGMWFMLQKASLNLSTGGTFAKIIAKMTANILQNKNAHNFHKLQASNKILIL
jgi:hypothetical protein